MAHFRGTLQGARGLASRLGTKSSGLSVSAASWSGKITVALSHRDGKDMFEIWQYPHHGRGISEQIAEGELGELAQRVVGSKSKAA